MQGTECSRRRLYSERRDLFVCWGYQRRRLEIIRLIYNDVEAAKDLDFVLVRCSLAISFQRGVTTLGGRWRDVVLPRDLIQVGR